MATKRPKAFTDGRKIGFLQGVAYACAELADAWDQPTMALEILEAAGLDSIQALEEANVDCADLERLRRHLQEECPECGDEGCHVCCPEPDRAIKIRTPANAVPRVDPTEVAAALGAEPVGRKQSQPWDGPASAYESRRSVDCANCNPLWGSTVGCPKCQPNLNFDERT